MRTTVVVAVAALGLAGVAFWFWKRAPHEPVRSVAIADSAASAVSTAAARPLPAEPTPTPVAASLPPALDEAALMTELRRIAASDPERAITVARDGNRRFADSADAPERTSILIHALATRGLSSEARGVAEEMVNHYPDSHWVREIELFTGAHRHRNARLDDAGRLEFY